jgi:hypothetical protein
MEVLSSGTVDERRLPRLRPSAPLAVAAALLVLAAAQATAVLRPQMLPAGASVEALPNGYSYATDGDRVVVGFQVRNNGDRDLEVVDIGAGLPGLELVDVTASGEPFRFEIAGGGTAPLPAFDLTTGTVIEVNLVYRVLRCADVPRDDRALAVAARTERGQGVLPLPLPRLPSDAVDAGPDDEDPWQQVLVRDVCP